MDDVDRNTIKSAGDSKKEYGSEKLNFIRVRWLLIPTAQIRSPDMLHDALVNCQFVREGQFRPVVQQFQDELVSSFKMGTFEQDVWIPCMSSV